MRLSGILAAPDCAELVVETFRFEITLFFRNPLVEPEVGGNDEFRHGVLLSIPEW
jgi:hypothetical protein